MKQQMPEQTKPLVKTKTKTKRNKRNAHSYVVHLKGLINLLLVRRLSRKSIADHTGLSFLTVCRYINVLHRGPKNLIYIYSYQRSATVGPYTELYTWGPGEQDAPRPAPLPKSKRNYATRLARKSSTVQTETGVIHHAD